MSEPGTLLRLPANRSMSGLFFGLAFGLGGIGSAVLGALADRHGIQSSSMFVPICR
jgi:hypothetical protein